MLNGIMTQSAFGFNSVNPLYGYGTLIRVSTSVPNILPSPLLVNPPSQSYLTV